MNGYTVKMTLPYDGFYLINGETRIEGRAGDVVEVPVKSLWPIRPLAKSEDIDEAFRVPDGKGE